MKSAFALLLEEARELWRPVARAPVSVHFDWDGTDGEESWTVWHRGPSFSTGSPRSFTGASGEQALRKMVESLHGR